MRRPALHAASAILVVCVSASAQDAPPADGTKPAPGDASDSAKVPVRSARGRVERIAVSADGSRIAAMTLTKVLVWDVKSAKPVLELSDDFRRLQTIELSKDGRWLLTLERNIEHEREANLWSVADPARPVATFGPKREREDGTMASYPLRAAALDADAASVRLYREGLGPSVVPRVEENGRVRWAEPLLPRAERGIDPSRRGLPKDVNSVSFAHDDSFVVVVDAFVRVYAWPGMKELSVINYAGARSSRAEVTAGGTIVWGEPFTAGSKYEHDVMAFDAKGTRLWRRGHTGLVAVSRGPGCSDAVLDLAEGPELVDTLTGVKSGKFPGAGTGTLTAATFSADGKYLWTARRDDGDVKRVPVPPRSAK